MSFGAIFVLAVGLSMDAAAVSAARGLATERVLFRHVLLVALFFGGAQALMPLIGWFIGGKVGPWVAAWDHWIAFGLLGTIGAKMLWEARGAGEEDAVEKKSDEALFGLRVMLVLAVATSIDAFAVGITLPILSAPLVLSIVTIGVTTAVLSALALCCGRKLGAMFGRRLDAVGGLVLIALGIKILIEHLSDA